VLCLGQFGSGNGGENVCCVLDSLLWVWGSDFMLCMGQFFVSLGE